MEKLKNNTQETIKTESFLDQVLEQPIIKKEPRKEEDRKELLPFGEGETFFIERSFDLRINFLEGMTRCGSENNNDVKVTCRIASYARDSQGFVFDNNSLSGIKQGLNNANMTVSCENLAIFVANAIHAKALVPLKWISVAVEADLGSVISYTWKEREELISVQLQRLICGEEAARIKASGGNVGYVVTRGSNPLLKGC